MNTKTETAIFPTFLASALINGDTSGLSEEDMPWLEAANAYAAPGHIVSCGEDSWFAWSCDLPGFDLGADVCEYTILYTDI